MVMGCGRVARRMRYSRSRALELRVCAVHHASIAHRASRRLLASTKTHPPTTHACVGGRAKDSFAEGLRAEGGGGVGYLYDA